MKVLKPLGRKVLIRKDPELNETKGGIILPDNAKEPPLRGTVIAVGPGDHVPGCGWVDMTLKVGDRVWFPTYAGNNIKVGDEDEELTAMTEADVICVEEDDGQPEPVKESKKEEENGESDKDPDKRKRKFLCHDVNGRAVYETAGGEHVYGDGSSAEAAVRVKAK